MITSFQQKVYEIIKKIPEGSVLTYKEVAERIGRPKSFRAVGNALHRNDNPVVPCHRVIRSDGRIGGYDRGIERKIKLLKKEKAIK